MEKEELEWKMRSFTTADCPNSSANSGPMSMSMMEGKLFWPNSQWYIGVSKVQIRAKVGVQVIYSESRNKLH
jgi:hypothetical protein